MLDRRTFLKAAGAGLALQSVTPAAPMSRRVFPLNRNWRYGGKTVPGATSPEFDDSKFERVTLPHSNVVLPWHSFDDKAYQFVSIYRRKFRLPSELRGHRVFVDFEGVMTAATVTLNGKRLGEHKGGYVPFSVELTSAFRWDGDNLLAVEVDSTERRDIPPFGGSVDYLTFGGIYREVSLRVTPPVFVENVFAMPVNVLTPERALEIRCYLAGDPPATSMTLTAELRDGARTVASVSQPVNPSAEYQTLRLTGLGDVMLWDIDNPKLYQVFVRLSGNGFEDHYETRTGIREARFTPQGFYLNGKPLKLRGLNRHQTYPYLGAAMPARVQRRDALILRKDFKCNVVRTSHYPQSRHFLDCCDEIGLLVFEEIPGWQHIGDQAWQDLAVRDVEAMIRRDWNHPSIILWGVRINESRDNRPFYERTNATARRLDPSRQTGGVRNNYGSELLEDVFTMNDFGWPMKPPNHPLYLVTEFNGHMFSTKRTDDVVHIAEHIVRHARVHDHLASDERYAGGIAWCAFDYATHANFGSGDRICYHGVADIFRIPKPAAAVYKSQCDPSEEIVLEPGFGWSWGDHPAGNGPGIFPICSNCDHLKIYIDGRLKTEVDPDRKTFPHLPHPPFMADLRGCRFDQWGDIKIEGYLQGKLVITRVISGRGTDEQLHILPDDRELNGDGVDATRVVIQITDEYGYPKQFASGAVTFSLEGPGELVGENPFGLVGGAGAVWVKAKEGAGTIRLTARHQYLGTKTVEIKVLPAAAEPV